LVLSKCSREIEVVGPIDPPLLVVQRWRNTKLDRRPFLDQPNRDEETSVEIHGICGDNIHFVGGVRRLLPARPSATKRVAPNDQHLLHGGCPLALDP
jgi:hypothetical protein